jgi:hypothetical protein
VVLAIAISMVLLMFVIIVNPAAKLAMEEMLIIAFLVRLIT